MAGNFKKLKTKWLLITLLTIWVAACGNETSSTKNNANNEVVVTQETLKKLEHEWKIQFPSSTQILGFSHEPAMDSMARLQFSVSRADVAKFVASSPLAEEEFEDDNRYLLGPDVEWWAPSKPAKLPTAQAYINGSEVLNVGMDQVDSEHTVIYILWHET